MSRCAGKWICAIPKLVYSFVVVEKSPAASGLNFDSHRSVATKLSAFAPARAASKRIISSAVDVE